MTATQHAIYENTETGTKVEVIAIPDPFDNNGSDQVEFETLDDSEWYGVFADNFRGNYTKIADSRDEL